MQGNARRALAEIDNHDVMRAYRRWAPVYDATFGKVVETSIKQTTSLANRYHDKVLEVGVNTDLSLPHYRHSLKITGIDLSPDMLQRARERVHKRNLRHVESLLEMDATEIKFTDDSFDVTVAMFVMTVVPDPVQVMNELIRVTKPGGHILIVNHFSIDKGLRAVVEKRLARFSDILGWRPDFPVETLMVSGKLRLEERRPLKPFGFFTLLRFQRLT